MFGPFELGTVLIETPLRNTPGSYMKPYMVRLVFLSNSFTKFGVGLSIPPVMFPTLDLFDMSPALTLHVLLNKVFEWTCVRKDLRLASLLVCSDCKEGQCFHIWNLGKLASVQGPPRHVWVACGFLVRPQHSKTGSTID